MLTEFLRQDVRSVTGCEMIVGTWHGHKLGLITLEGFTRGCSSSMCLGFASGLIPPRHLDCLMPRDCVWIRFAVRQLATCPCIPQDNLEGAAQNASLAA
jgi:hypothetical protein